VKTEIKEPMNRIRIGIVGLNFGRHIVTALMTGPGKEFFELAAVCDLDVDKARQVAADNGVKAYTGLDDLLKDSTIPTIGLFTGPVGRAKLVRTIVNAGKHVLTTKPFELDPVAALAVLNEARGLKRVIHLNSPGPLWPPDLAQANTWRKQFDLGRPVACQMSVWVRYHEQANNSWYDNPALCPVAPVFRLGIYLINDLVRLFGEAERVQVMSSRLFTGRPTPDNAQLGIQFKNGAIATIFASFCIEDGDIYQNAMTLNFDKGTVYRNAGPYRRGTNRRAVDMALVMGNAETGGKVVAEADLQHASGDYQWDAFSRAVRGETLPDEVTPEQIVAGLRVIEAMTVADRTGGTAVVKPVISAG